MPYIKPEDRPRALLYPTTPGELNYAITKMIGQYARAKGHSYQTFNDIIGALEGAKQEFYRRVVSPYEDAKCKLNGDVYL